MNQTTNSFPSRVILATDLSARCDRALDRAVQLAGGWDATLLVMTVLEPRNSPEELYAWAAREDDTARQQFIIGQIQRDAARLDVPFELRIAEGNVADRIREAAATVDSGLVVTGVARGESLGRIFVGDTVGRLARGLEIPLLVVRERARGPYRRILVATDFSEASRHALKAGLALFPGEEITLYHALGSIRAFGGPEAAVPAEDNAFRAGEQECAEFLDGSGLSEEDRARLHLVMEPHEVEIALPRYARENQIDLAIIGTRGRSRVVHVLLGSAASSLVQWLPCDTMLVRRPL